MIKRVPWFRMLKKTDPEPPLRLPVAGGSISNGESWWPDNTRKQLIRKLVFEKAEEVARKEGIDRREFLMSSCGMATTLYMINMVSGCGGGSKGGDMRLGMSGAGTGGGPAGMGGGGSGPAGMGGGGGGNPGGMGGGDPGTGGTGGFNVPPDAMTDPGVADLVCGNGGNELVIDMQSHFANRMTNPIGAVVLQGFLANINACGRLPWIVRTPGTSGPTTIDQDEYVNQILLGSDTTIGVLSGISYAVGVDPVTGKVAGGSAVLSNEDLLSGAGDIMGSMKGDFSRRMLTHCMVMPNDRKDLQFDMMRELSAKYSNWKTYPPWAPGGGTGYWLDQGVGPEMIQLGIDLGSPIFCIHKGFPLNGFSATHCDPKDVGPAATMFPDAILVIYHSAFENGLSPGGTSAPLLRQEGGCGVVDMNNDYGWGPGVGEWPEGPYDESLEDAASQPTTPGSYPLNRGVNSLIWSLRKAGIGPNGVWSGGPRERANVYAECGGVWPALMMGRPQEAMHYWGKLLKYVGEDRMVWGTDCLWFGSPQPLIEAFRAFQISQEFMDKYGYPQLTQRAKEKVLGQNAARIQSVRDGVDIKGCHSDYVGQMAVRRKRDLDEEFGRRRDMIEDVVGPRTRREFLSLVRHENEEKERFSANFPDREGPRPEVTGRG